MSTVNRYTPEEDRRILEAYWDPKRRKEVAEEMADRHTARSIQFRYFQLLKLLNLGGSPTYRKMMEQHEKGNLELPFTIDELVEKVHSGEAREEAKERKRKKKAVHRKEHKEAPKEPIPMPEPKTAMAVREEAPIFDESQPVSIIYSEDIDKIVEYLASLEKRMVALEEKNQGSALTDFFTIVSLAAQHQDKLAHVDSLIEENKRLQQQLEELEKKYQEKVAEFDDIYQRLDEVFGRYLRLTSVKKALSLEDFIDQIGVVVDKFGTVIGLSTRDRGVRGVIEAKEA